jgi:alkyldihydroxyacetonephosphate synthase
MLWSGWGDPAQAAPLPPALRGLLEQALGVRAGAPAVALDEVRLPPVALGLDVLAQLAGAVGDVYVDTTDEARIRHTRGKSTVDLLRIRAGEADDAPDAVLSPGSHDEVLAVLRVATERAVAVVPFGGGTSVVGGLAARREGFAGVVALDLGRLDRLVAVDPVSRTATFEPGVRAPQAEALLAPHGFTLGHFPQSFEYASIGGFAATRSSGQSSAGYGRFDDLVAGLRVATPRGTVEAGRAPRSAAGPDLRQLFLGSEGTLGVITAVTVRIRPTPAQRVVEAWGFESFTDGIEAVRRLAQDGPLPTVVRLSDEYETAVNTIRPGETSGAAGGCLAIVGYDGSDVTGVRDGAGAVLRKAGATPLGTDLGEAWVRGRFQAPYLRDALLDMGALAETLETATFWSGLVPLYEAVRAAVIAALDEQGTAPLLLCHVSHVYPTGASLYFTVVCAQADDPVAQWRRAKDAATGAILAAGGTVTHHHAVGADHAAGYRDEVGPLALDALRSVKASLDPAGILNPGILLG